MEIKKLEDVVVWFDNWIEETKLDLTEEDMKDDTTIKEFETIKKVILKSIDRHAVYTNALNEDIANKAAKIDLLEKEIEGRKEGYVALKELMDTDYISIEEHNNIVDQFKEEIEKLKKERDKHMAMVNDLRMELDCVKASKEKHEEAAHDKVVDGLRETISYWRNKYVAAQEEIEKLDGTIEEWKNQERIRTDQLRATERKVEELWKEIEKFTKGEEDDHGRAGFKRYIKYLIEEEERAVPERFKERLNKEITEIFTKEEETEVNDIPCGEDAIE